MPHYILCIESSYQLCSVGITDGIGCTVSESTIVQNHAESLMGLIQDCLNKADIPINKLSAVAVSAGPGSYTGLRIGTSTAKGICFALDIPLIEISTLQTLAYGARTLNPQSKGLLWAMIDARRMEVYHCVFDQDLVAQTAVKSGIIGEDHFVPALIGADTIICGDGANKAEEALGLKLAPVTPHAKWMAALAEGKYLDNNVVNLDTFEPFYLKFANITKPSIKY